jgi:glycosyltransferase involved in cell wall biosynthesis
VAQTFTDWEMVIVDDGSTDETAAIVASIQDPRIKFFRLPHRGIAALSDSYATALANSNAPLLAILDGDDYWKPNKLASQVPLFDDEEVILAFAEADLVDGEGRQTGVGTIPKYATGKHHGTALTLPLLQARFWPFSVTVMVRRLSIERIGGFVQPEGLPLVDVPTWLNIFPTGHVVGLPSRLAAYRVHPASVCRSISTLEEQQMKFAEEFFHQHWQSLGIRPELYGGMRRSLIALNAHRLAVLQSRRGDHVGAISSFRVVLANGSPVRILKTVVRYVVTRLFQRRRPDTKTQPARERPSGPAARRHRR